MQTAKTCRQGSDCPRLKTWTLYAKRPNCETCWDYDRLDAPKPTDREERFRAWYHKVNTAFIAISGLDVADVPDMPYWDMFEEHMTPMRAARRILKECMSF